MSQSPPPQVVVPCSLPQAIESSAERVSYASDNAHPAQCAEQIEQHEFPPLHAQRPGERSGHDAQARYKACKVDGGGAVPRPGSPRSAKLDVRVIGATHRNLRANPENKMHAAARIKPVVVKDLSGTQDVMAMFDSFVQSQASLLRSQRVIEYAMQSDDWKKIGRPLDFSIRLTASVSG